MLNIRHKINFTPSTELDMTRISQETMTLCTRILFNIYHRSNGYGMPHSSDIILFKVRINHEANEGLALTIDCLRNSQDRTMRKIVPCLHIVSIVSLTSTAIDTELPSSPFPFSTASKRGRLIEVSIHEPHFTS